MASVTFHDVAFRRGEVDVLTGIDLAIDDGEIVVVVGPSGSGKSTILRLIAGLEAPTSGVVVVGDQPTGTRTTPGVAMVAEQPGLYEHLDVGGNLSFPLLIRGDARDEAQTAARTQADELQIRSLVDRTPGKLSAGQRDLVATGRALIRPEIEVLLLDELLARADLHLRVRVRDIIRDLHLRRGPTVVLATNDPAEAMALADRVAVLSDGALRQFDPPMTVYHDPVSLDVADIISSYPINRLKGVLRSGDPGWVIIGENRLLLPRRLGDEHDGKPLVVGIRPEDLSLTDSATGPSLEGRAVSEAVLGRKTEIHFELEPPDGDGHVAVVAGNPEIPGVIRLAVARLLLFTPDGARWHPANP